MARKKINDINKIWNGRELLINDFSNLNLQGLDLGGIPEDAWKGCVFNNTNFKGTNIKFKPKLLKTTTGMTYHSKGYFEKIVANIFMINCDFSDNNLSYLTKEDLNNVCYEGCNFKNTGLIDLPEMIDIIVDDYFLSLDFRDFDSFKNFDIKDFYNCKDKYNFSWDYYNTDCKYHGLIDLKTIKKNPQLKLPSSILLKAAFSYCCVNRDILTKEKIVEDCESILCLDKQGYLRDFYNLLKDNMTVEQKYNFFNTKVEGLNLKDIEIRKMPLNFLWEYEFKKNIFDGVTINNGINDLIFCADYFLYDIGEYKNTYNSLYLPNIKYDSWKENFLAKRRVANGSLTFLTKVYVELSRECNARCEFCRNKSFEKSNYDLQAIINILDEIKWYVNSVVIGGGEPTLKLEDAKKLRKFFYKSHMDFHLFTNGTSPKFIDDEYVMKNFKINLSRHAVSDLENAKLFKVNEKKIMTTKDIEKLNLKNNEVTLNATCFNGGLDSFDKIISYINFAKNVGCKKVLIQDLQKKLSLGINEINYNTLCIKEDIFPKVISYLKDIGFEEKYPIYATGGYVAYVLKDKNDFTISIQKYITKEQLEQNWFKAVKRTFDLSISPSGNLYENWHQTSGMVKSIGSK